MKLYYFNPHDYGQQAFVMAESKEKAKEYLLKSRPATNIINFGEGNIIDLNQFKNETIDDMVNLRNKYTLDEFNVGEIIWSEIS